MTRAGLRRLLWLLVAIGPFGGCLQPSIGAEAGRPPNVIVIFTDDQGYQDLGCYGSPTIKTPHVDRLAKEGMKLTSFYVAAPLCTPSRAALMTGCYPKRIGLAAGVLRPDSRRGLHPEEVTIAEVLKTRGYATGCIGKWHLGFIGPFRPTRQGFDFYYGLYHNLDHWETEYFDDKGGPPIFRGERIERRPATPDVLVDLYTKEAVDFITRNKDRPFFLYLAHQMPHVPLGVPPRMRGKSAGGLFGDVIEHVDWSTGEIVDAVRRLGLEAQTVIVYTSDNGPSPLATGSALPLRGRKHTTFEGGMRVPAIVWGPGRVPAGAVCDAMILSMDLLPTFARLAGAEPPADRKIDGKDVWPLLAGQPDAKSPHEAFLYYNGRGELEAIRAGKWKLRVKSGELFDLETDVAESQDLAAEHPETVGRLKSLMATMRDDVESSPRPAGQWKAETL
ncbi:MAG: sulfatase family protein [Planctomycetota bacterium]|jgi:arylsulfatase A-like enzyme